MGKIKEKYVNRAMQRIPELSFTHGAEILSLLLASAVQLVLKPITSRVTRLLSLFCLQKTEQIGRTMSKKSSKQQSNKSAAEKIEGYWWSEADTKWPKAIENSYSR